MRKLVFLTIDLSVMSEFLHYCCRYWFCVTLVAN